MILSQLPTTTPHTPLHPIPLCSSITPPPPLCFLSFHIVLRFNAFAAGTSLNIAAKPQINDLALVSLSLSLWLHLPFCFPPPIPHSSNFWPFHPHAKHSLTYSPSLQSEKGDDYAYNQRGGDIRLLTRCLRHKTE